MKFRYAYSYYIFLIIRLKFEQNNDLKTINLSIMMDYIDNIILQENINLCLLIFIITVCSFNISL